MIKAIETGVVGFSSHLEECESCRILFELLSSFRIDDSEKLAKSSPKLLRQIESIPKISRKERRAEIIRGLVVFDSWSNLVCAQLRSGPSDLTRRLLLKAGAIKLELTAERHQDTWEFAAKVYDRGKATEKFVIEIGRRRVAVGPSGFFYWTSKRPPVKVGLCGESRIIEFEGLSW